MIQWYNTVINKDCCAGALASDCRWIYLEQLKWLWLLLPCCRLLPTQQARQGRSCICPCANAVYSPCAYVSWNKWQLMLMLQILNWDVKKWDCDCLCHFSLPAGMCQCAHINSTLGSGRLCEQSPWFKTLPLLVAPCLTAGDYCSSVGNSRAKGASKPLLPCGWAVQTLVKHYVDAKSWMLSWMDVAFGCPCWTSSNPWQKSGFLIWGTSWITAM